MKKSLIALAVLAASGAAMAQSSVTLYGVADAYVGSQKANAVTVSGTRLVSTATRNSVVESGGLSGSRWGLRGTEDLGNGMKANFVLESGFDISNGASQQGGALFGRQAFVGLGGGFGAVSLGRQYNAYDEVKGGFLSAEGNSPNFDATGSTAINAANLLNLAAVGTYNRAGAAATAGQRTAAAAALTTLAGTNTATGRYAGNGAWTGYQTRVNNAVRYETPNISGFKAALVYRPYWRGTGILQRRVRFWYPPKKYGYRW
jgi:predicted porin